MNQGHSRRREIPLNGWKENRRATWNLLVLPLGRRSGKISSVFHAGQEPFIATGRRRLDEIIQSVRACPSDTLSYAIDGVKARSQVDQPRAASIEVSKDGPYRVTGGLRLTDEHGNDVGHEPPVHHASIRVASGCGHENGEARRDRPTEKPGAETGGRVACVWRSARGRAGFAGIAPLGRLRHGSGNLRELDRTSSKVKLSLMKARSFSIAMSSSCA